MKLTLQRRKKYGFSDEYYYEYETFELESWRWLPNHKFEYVIKDSCSWKELQENEEIVRFE